MAGIDDSARDEENEEMANDEFKQEALFDSSEFKREPVVYQQFRYETTEELLRDFGEFSDQRFWDALNRERGGGA